MSAETITSLAIYFSETGAPQSKLLHALAIYTSKRKLLTKTVERN
jgi:hypothetical protein